ncbi:DMT family transporter [Roseovarius sp. 2305UL8-3]|uniref:DMT family transporter n=1 Tax=Roseovarius conchicola TaxID=3121636 RepID=UPI003528E701
MASENISLPVILAFVSALLWGIWWIPIRYLESLGMSGAWGSVTMNIGAAAAALAFVTIRRVPLQISARGVMGATLVGVAVTFYSVAITFSDVVRVVLLFYLAPAWSKIIEWAFLGQRWGWPSTAAVGLSLLGAYLVLGGDISLDGIGFGDVLGVISGMAWAGGAALIFTGGRMNAMSLSLVTAIAATLIGAVFILPGAGDGLAGLGDWSAKGMGALAGVVYVLPILALTLWSAQRLSPAVISFLLTAEILSGVITGALFLDEPFGVMQAAGAVLILLAAAVEVVPAVMRKPV